MHENKGSLLNKGVIFTIRSVNLQVRRPSACKSPRMFLNQRSTCKHLQTQNLERLKKKKRIYFFN